MNRFILFVLALCGFLISCSHQSQLSSPCQITGQTIQQSPDYGRQLWGIWDVIINPQTMSACLIPVRSAEFTCNVIKFMQPPASNTNLVSYTILPGSEPAKGYIKALVTVKHPFISMNKYNGFDVRGILLTDGSVNGKHDPSVARAGATDTRLLNADGYTRFWNYPEFTSYNSLFGFTSCKIAPPNNPTGTVNPYKYFAQGLNETSPVTSIDFAKRGFFPTNPGVGSREYEIQFKIKAGKPEFKFQFAVDASWSPPDPSYAPNYPPEAYSLDANCQEAFAVSVNDEGSTAYFVDSSIKGGEVMLNIEVYDWQSIANPNGVSGEVAAIWVEGSIFPSPVNILQSATILPGSSAVSAIFKVSMGGLNLTKSGEEEIFITVENSLPNTYKPQIPGGDASRIPHLLLLLMQFRLSRFPIKPRKSRPPSIQLILTGVIKTNSCQA